MTRRTIGHYEILDKLGEGGMGVVWKARDTNLHRLVAIKLLPPDKVANPERERRFIQEARAASALNHPNIVTVYDISSEDGIAFIVMEYLPGKTLDQLIPRKGLRTAETLKYAIQIADALAQAHAAGIIHRDLKPSNIMVAEDGRLKVLDFGLAKLTEAWDASEDEATRTIHTESEEGTILGTVSYMSPEQAEGKKVDARSDIFAFGAVLYEMVTGQRAFQGDSRMSTVAAILNKEPKPVNEIVEDVPRDLEKIITRCLRKDRDRRLQHSADLKVALLDLKEESDSGTLARTPAASRPRRPWIWIAALAGVTALAAIGWFILPLSKTKEAPPIVRPLTSYQGSESWASFSPDGNQVAFSWNGEKQDNYDIYVKLVDSGPPLRLTSHPADDISPAWSPDGRQIAFLRTSSNSNEILLISPLGGPERKLAEVDKTGSGSSWSPDGKFLAVRDQRAIALVSIQSGEKRRFTSPPTGIFGDAFPAFSPDGRTLAFYRQMLASGDIFLAPVSDGLQIRQLTHDNREVNGLAWTPNGKEIVFSSARGGDNALWRIPALGGAPEPLPTVGPDASLPAIARQSSRAAFTRSINNGSIWRLDIGPAGHVAPPTRLIASSRSDSLPRISPDGRRIAFVSTRSGSSEMWVCDSQGGGAVQLTSFGGGLGPPSWSPDSSKIVFIARPETRSDIFVIGAGGGSPRPLTAGPFDENNPSWSRDGHWIYFGSNRGGTRQVWKMPAEGGKATQVTRHGGFTGFESMDGKYFYYVLTPVGGSIWKVPLDGGDETLVLPANLRWWTIWALGDQGIYFLDFAGEGTERKMLLKLYRFDTRQTTQIAALEQPVRTDRVRLSLSPDALWLVYSQLDRSESDLMLIDNFR
jgi:serine/threonine protein kinase